MRQPEWLWLAGLVETTLSLYGTTVQVQSCAVAVVDAEDVPAGP